jgi:hypothetical protein
MSAAPASKDKEKSELPAVGFHFHWDSHKRMQSAQSSLYPESMQLNERPHVVIRGIGTQPWHKEVPKPPSDEPSNIDVLKTMAQPKASTKRAKYKPERGENEQREYKRADGEIKNLAYWQKMSEPCKGGKILKTTKWKPPADRVYRYLDADYGKLKPDAATYVAKLSVPNKNKVRKKYVNPDTYVHR